MPSVAADPFEVSVVIPAFNESSRIAAAVSGIRNQTEPPREIIVVDDGSKDDTAAIAKSLGVRVIRQANGGISAARNTGIRESSGSWIAFCDADDIWDPRMLSFARQAHEASPGVDFIFADHRTDISGRIAQESMFAHAPGFRRAAGARLARDFVYFERRALAHELAFENFIAPSTAIVRREFVVSHSIYFNSHLPTTKDYLVAEDIEWYLRVLSATDALAIDKVMLTYHRHEGSLSSDAGRVRYGNVVLGDFIAKSPAGYAPNVAAAFARNRRAHIRASAIDDVRSQRFARARGRFAEAQRIRFQADDAAFAALTTLADGPGGRLLANVARVVWRSGLKPAVKLLRHRTD